VLRRCILGVFDKAGEDILGKHECSLSTVAAFVRLEIMMWFAFNLRND
jgi:hypothetical protein